MKNIKILEKLLLTLLFEIKRTKNHLKKLRMFNKNLLYENVKHMLMAQGTITKQNIKLI